MGRGRRLASPGWCDLPDLREHCGIIGVVCRDGSAAERGTYGLQALQHRGQESAGIASCAPSDTGIRLHKGMRLVSEVFNQDTVSRLKGNIAIGHVLHSKGGLTSISDAEPLLFHYPWGDAAIATNGSLVNGEELRASLGAAGAAFQTTSDAELIGCLLAKHGSECLENKVRRCMTELEGAYSAVVMTPETLVAMRDPRGFKPLCLGKFPGGWAVASESCALDVIGAELLGPVAPGEIVIIDKEGLRKVQGQPCSGRSMCIFEYVYFARPDSIIEGVNVSQARHEMGRMLAREHKNVQADIVVPVPEAGVEAGLGFARESGIPFEYGLVRNRYLGRTFIRPEPDARRLGVRLKLNAVRQAVQGKHVLVVDDSIVRGTTSTRLVRLLREAGAKSVGLMIASPPVIYPCHYGIGTAPASDQCLAASNGKSSVLRMTGADSLNYLSCEGLLQAMENAGARDMGFCLGCFDGCYPVVAQGRLAKAEKPDEFESGEGTPNSQKSESSENPENSENPEKAGTRKEARATYAGAGVDIDRGMRSVELIKEVLKKMPSDRLIGGLGGFGGSFVLDAGGPRDMVLVAGTDGVGTKLRVAIEADRHDTIGIDAVAMCVNDVVTSGAEPLFFLDYLAQGKIDAERVQAIVSGVAEGCMRAGCVLLGGETAEMPGFYEGDDYDIAGFAVGAVERSNLIDGAAIEAGDILIGLASSGLHSNGFSLARHILFDIACLSLSDEPVELGRPLADELLEPTRIYVKSILDLAKSVEIRGLAHITGGGLIDNPPRMLPPGLAIRLDLGSWHIPPIFDFLQKLGNVEDHEMRRTFNMGLGFIVAVRPYDVDTALEALTASGERCCVVGQVIPGNGEVLFVNG
jgi:amidophosphoribosyltransferase